MIRDIGSRRHVAWTNVAGPLLEDKIALCVIALPAAQHWNIVEFVNDENAENDPFERAVFRDSLHLYVQINMGIRERRDVLSGAIGFCQDGI